MHPTDPKGNPLRGCPVFSSLDEASLWWLAAVCEAVAFAQGTPVVSEGGIGNDAFLILEGSAEVSAQSPDGPVVLAILSSGEIFGELALLMASRKRSATVTATTPLRLLKIPGDYFKRLVAEKPQLRAQFDSMAESMFNMRFLKLCASPFSVLPQDSFRKLASRLKSLRVPAGDVIVRQGEEGDSCFVIRKGEVEVLLEQTGGEVKQLATLGPGTLFGEASLLTVAPRNSTVKALEPCELLVLKREDLVEAFGETPRLGFQLKELLQMRMRPERVPGVLSFQNKSASGEIVMILKDPARNAYYRLSPQGYFIWQRLDGHRSLKDLTLDYWGEFKAFAPQAIAGILSGLTRSGFVQGPVFRLDLEAAGPFNFWKKFAEASRKILECQISFKNIDKPLGNFYKAGVHRLYTRPGQVILGLISIAGLIVFAASAGRVEHTVQGSSPWLLLFFIPAQILTLLIHEAGHAFTTKAIGREVLGAGVGWYWYSPIAFVDTSDTWLASRWQRVIVSIAGPYANLILGSVISLIACTVSDCSAQVVLWQVAFSSYVMVIMNLNPLLEYDGYYILTDLLDRPNLRREVLAWLGKKFIPNLKNPGVLREHLFDILFGLGSILYVAIMAAMIVILYRVFLQGWLAGFIPEGVAAGFAWALAALVILFSTASIIGDLKDSSSK